MLRIIERTPSHFIQKIVDTKGNCIRYQTVPRDADGKPAVGDTNLVQPFDTLVEAREYASSKASVGFDAIVTLRKQLPDMWKMTS
jgi:hypothetical protein